MPSANTSRPRDCYLWGLLSFKKSTQSTSVFLQIHWSRLCAEMWETSQSSPDSAKIGITNDYGRPTTPSTGNIPSLTQWGTCGQMILSAIINVAQISEKLPMLRKSLTETKRGILALGMAWGYQHYTEKVNNCCIIQRGGQCPLYSIMSWKQ